MALPQSWSSLANGVHILEYDLPNISTPRVASGRLVIGSSYQGKKNDVVILSKTGDRQLAYGSTDKKLESKNSYFHFTIDSLLNEGAVYALNVVPMTTETAQFLTLNSDSADTNGSLFLPDKAATNSLIKNEEGRRFYNRTGLWYLSDEELNRVKNNTPTSVTTGTDTADAITDNIKNKIISFANLSNKDVTVFVKQSDKAGFDVTAKAWYANLGLEVPAYVHPDDYINDYMIQVIVVAGDWTNYPKLSSDVTFGSYFNEGGLIISKMNEFFNQKAVSIVAKVDGCVIPDFKDTSGNNISIDVAFNNLETLTEMNIAIDKEMFASFDLNSDAFSPAAVDSFRFDIVGHSVDTVESSQIFDDKVASLIDTISYRAASKNTMDFKITTGTVNQSSVVVVPTVNGATTINKVLAYVDSNVYRAWSAGVFKTGDISKGTSNVYIKVVEGYATISATQYKTITIEGYSDVTLTTPASITISTVLTDELFNVTTTKEDFTKEIPLVLADKANVAFVDNYDMVTYHTTTTDISNTGVSGLYEIKAYTDTALYKMYVDGQIADGTQCIDTVAPIGTPITIKITTGTDVVGNYIVVKGYDALNAQVDLYIDATGTASCTLATTQYAKVLKETPNKVIITIPSATTTNAALVTSITNSVKKGRYLAADVDGVRPRMLKVQSVTKVPGSVATTSVITITTDSPSVDSVLGISISSLSSDAPTLTVKQGIKNYCTSLNGFLMKKFTVKTSAYPDGTPEREGQLMKFLFDTNIADTLVQTRLLDWRFVVDSFGGNVESNTKYWIGRLAAMKATAAAFVNLPSIKLFEKSTDPSFIYTDASNMGIFNFEYLATGGNLDLNPSSTFSVASGLYNEREISTYIIPSFDYIGVRVNGVTTPRPWAAYHCNAYQRLFNAGNKFVGAMNETGVLTDPEIAKIYTEYGNNARVILQNLGYNYLVTNPNGKPTIFSNYTAYNKNGSSLSRTHVRISLIEIEKYISELSFPFTGRKVTTQMKNEMYNAVDKYLKGLKSNSDIHTYKLEWSVVDNDADAKANGGLVLDIALSFDPLAEKIINRYTVNPMGSDSVGFKIS